ncbi:reverse transcriptase domain-containing protein [Tanacetum coccineum]
MLKDIQSLNEKLAALSRFLSKGAERSLPFIKVLKSCTDKKNIQWTQEAAVVLQEMKKFVETLPTLTAPIHGEVLMMYLAALTESINTALFARREKGQAHTVVVLTNSSIKQTLTKPEKSERVAKWAIEMGEHDIVFQTRDDSNKEMPKDFLIEAPPEDNRKEVERKTDMKLEDTKLSYEWKLYTDGASRSNGSGARLILIDPEGKKYTYALRFKFETTNNEPEYEALLAGLRIAQEMEIYLQRIKETLRSFMSYTIEHIIRNQNKKVDALSKLALMTFEHLTKKVLVKVLVRRSIEEKEVLQVETKEEESWMTPIHEYLLSGLLPEDPKESRKIRIKAPQYKLIKGSLYKKSFYTSWLRCIAPPNTNDVIKEIHEGSCGFNTEPRSMVVRITKQGYYWPSMHRDISRSLGSQHSRTLINCPMRIEILSSSHKTLHQMDRSKASDHSKDGRGRTKEMTKRKESKEVVLIEKAYYQNELQRFKATHEPLLDKAHKGVRLKVLQILKYDGRLCSPWKPTFKVGIRCSPA